MTEREKFKSAQNVFNRITAELTDLPDSKFQAALDTLESWWSGLRQGDVAMPANAGSARKTDTAVAESQATPDEEEPPIQITKSTVESDDDEKGNAVHVGTVENMPPKPSRKPQQKKMKPFNPRKRNGRQRKDRATESAKISEARKAYRDGVKLRNALRGDDVTSIEEFIKSCEPPLKDVTSFINTLEVRKGKWKVDISCVEKRTPVFVTLSYRLQQSLVIEALSLIERRTPFGDAMDLTTPADPTEECWVVKIDGVGDVTQRQLMAMQYLWSWDDICRKGNLCYS